jgi:TolB-like protein/cytochrome c-type biogenesis protein CcmH/NrfG
MTPAGFFAELKRRHVYRVAVAYAVVAWLLIQIATQVFPFFEVPNWAVRLVVLLLAAGFPVALVLAWAYELTPQGVKRTGELPRDEAVRRSSGRKLDFTIIAVLLAAVALLLYDRFRHRSSDGANEKSIAVLPFENLSSDPENAFFADGVHDEILTDLARVADLKVISRTSVLQYKGGAPRNLRQIGRELGVAHVLEGSVQRAGNRVRVNAQLIDAQTDGHLWGQSYDRNLADVFAIQSEIAQAIVAQLRAQLSPDEKRAIERPATTDIAAFDLYTRARKMVDRSSSFNRASELEEPIALLNQAIARDPSFFHAYCQLAEAHDLSYVYAFDHTPARLALAQAAIDAAFRLRPDSGEAHLAKARHLYQGFLDYNAALAELEIARQTLPNDSHIFELIGYIARRKGRWAESTRNLERASVLDPRNFQIIRQILTVNYHYFRRFADEKAAFARILAIEPGDLNARTGLAGVAAYSDADPQPFCDAIEAARASDPAAAATFAKDRLFCAFYLRDARRANEAFQALGRDPVRFASDNVLFNRAFVEAIVARLNGDEPKAHAAFLTAREEQQGTVAAQPDYAPALCVLGVIDAALGRREDALKEGRRAVELVPVEKDAIQGTAMLKYLAIITAWVGDLDAACKQVAALLQGPSTINFGELQLLPLWEPLHKAPCFPGLLEEAKKPVALSETEK